MGICLRCANIMAKSRAWYLKPFSCFNELSCSSSTIIKPKFLNGENKEERVPTSILSLSVLQLNHTVARCLSAISECKQYTPSPKRSRNRLNNCGVRPISGTNSNICFCWAKTSFIMWW